VAESKIILDRVVGIELAQCRGDFLGRCPGRGAAIRESEIPTDAVDVRIDGNQERRGRKRPEPEVHAIGPSDHPSRIEEEPLAGASGARITDEVTQGSTRSIPSKGVGKTGHALPEIASAFGMEPGKRFPQCLFSSEQLSRVPEHHRQVLGTVDAMNEALEQAAKLGVVGFHDGRCRRGAQGCERPIDASPRGHGVSKGQAGSNEPYDLLIAGFIVTVKEVYGISAAGGLPIAVRQKRVESFADTIHGIGVLAILPCELQ
jgi:hypothetical protein